MCFMGLHRRLRRTRRRAPYLRLPLIHLFRFDDAVPAHACILPCPLRRCKPPHQLADSLALRHTVCAHRSASNARSRLRVRKLVWGKALPAGGGDRDRGFVHHGQEVLQGTFQVAAKMHAQHPALSLLHGLKIAERLGGFQHAEGVRLAGNG